MHVDIIYIIVKVNIIFGNSCQPAWPWIKLGDCSGSWH